MYFLVFRSCVEFGDLNNLVVRRLFVPVCVCV